MYRLLTGLHAYLTQKEERSVIIIGLDNAGKSTLLEQVKVCPPVPSLGRVFQELPAKLIVRLTQHQYNPNTPRPDVSRIAPTVGQGGQYKPAFPPLFSSLPICSLGAQ